MTDISSHSGLPSPGVTDQRPVPSAADGKRPSGPVPAASVRPVQSAQHVAAAPPADAQLNAEALQRASDALQRRVRTVAPELEFSVDHSSGRSMIKVTDRTTKEIIQQIPSDETLQLDKELDLFEKGMLLNRKA